MVQQRPCSRLPLALNRPGGGAVRKSDNFPLIIAGSGLGLGLLLHTVWNILLEDWLKHQLEHYFGLSVADMIEKFGAVGFPLLVAAGIVWFLYQYLETTASKRYLEDIAPRIRFSSETSVDVLTFADNGGFAGEESFISVTNPGNSILEKCLVKLEAIAAKGCRQETQSAVFTKARQKDGHAGRFALSPGEKKLIALTSRRGRMGMHSIPSVSLLTETRMELQLGDSYLLEIVALAESGLPDRRRLDLTVALDGSVTIAWQE